MRVDLKQSIPVMLEEPPPRRSSYHFYLGKILAELIVLGEVLQNRGLTGSLALVQRQHRTLKYVPQGAHSLRSALGGLLSILSLGLIGEQISF